MDDDQILARGGTQDDINTYAKRNGADLTKEDFLQEEREKARQSVVEDMMKRCRLTQTYNFLKNYKQNHLSKKGEKK